VGTLALIETKTNPDHTLYYQYLTLEGRGGLEGLRSVASRAPRFPAGVPGTRGPRRVSPGLPGGQIPTPPGWGPGNPSPGTAGPRREGLM